ncbi:MAG TPA: hypothetical protein VGI93_11225 [Steroidobacteraceae bacterium]|jgi:hypothetical protein
MSRPLQVLLSAAGVAVLLALGACLIFRLQPQRAPGRELSEFRGLNGPAEPREPVATDSSPTRIPTPP